MEEKVFFLKIQDDLPSWFMEFSQNFNNFGIKLIPVSLESFFEIAKKNERETLIVLVNNLSSKRAFSFRVQDILEKLIKSSRLHLFHLSSFPEDKLRKKLKRTPYYRLFELPCNLEELVVKIVSDVKKNKSNGAKWVWGNRSGLLDSFSSKK